MPFVTPRSLRHAVAAAWLALPLADAAQTVFTATGTAADITPEVNGMRAALGTLNPNQPTTFAGGRREINWDAVPDARADPNLFPGDFFNGNVAPRARGIVFSTPGTGFLVSANAGAAVPTAFGFPADFVAFSAQRMFAPVGSVITDVRFFSPADQKTAATTTGFGAVFEDVETEGLSKLEYFDLGDRLLATVVVPHNAASASLSFGGAVFDQSLVARVRIHTGDGVLLANGLFGSGTDGVVMDDFLFGEPLPVPEPQTWALMLGGATALLGWSRRRRAA